MVEREDKSKAKEGRRIKEKSNVKNKIYKRELYRIYTIFRYDKEETSEKRKRKAKKSEWRMPRLKEAKKDVISCEKSGVGANNLRSRNIRMGQPGTVKPYHSLRGRRTRGTETSKYP